MSEVALPVLSALVDKSLLQRLPSGRFQLHELLRQYGQEQLASQPGEEETARARHCRTYASVLARYEAALRDNREEGVYYVIQEDADDILKAWRWAIAHHDSGAVEAMRQGVLKAAQDISHEPLGAVILECTNLVTFRSDVQRLLGVPVFDMVSLIEFFAGGYMAREFSSRYAVQGTAQRTGRP